MTRSIIWKEQTRFIEDAVESWQRDHQQAMQALDVDAVLEVCVVLGNYIHKLLAATWDELFAGRLTDVQERGSVFQRAFEQSALAFADLAAVARGFADSGHELSHYVSFVAAHEQFLHVKDDFERRWPHFHAATLQAQRTQAADFVDPEELYRDFPELRGASPG